MRPHHTFEAREVKKKRIYLNLYFFTKLLFSSKILTYIVNFLPKQRSFMLISLIIFFCSFQIDQTNCQQKLNACIDSKVYEILDFSSGEYTEKVGLEAFRICTNNLSYRTKFRKAY